MDIIGMAEMGISWNRIPTKDRLWERTRGWFESVKLAVAHNRQDTTTSNIQWGGTSLWSLNNAAHRAIESGSDLSVYLFVIEI